MSQAPHDDRSYALEPASTCSASGAWTAVAVDTGLHERPEIAVLQGLRRIMRAVELHSKRLASTYSVTGPQLVCLSVLGEEGPISQKALGGFVSLGASTITGVVDRLEARGLVERQRDKTDRRRILVALTDAGRELIARAPSPLQETLAKKLEALPWEEQLSVARSVQRLVDMMEARDIDASPILTTGDIAADIPKNDTPKRSAKNHA